MRPCRKSVCCWEMLVKQKIERTNQKGRAKLLFNLNKWSGYIFSLFASCSYSFLPRSLYIIHKRRHRSSNSSSVCITFSLFRSSLDLDVCGVLLFLPNVLLHFCCCCSSLARLFVFFSSYRSIHNLLPTVNMDGDGVLAANEKKKIAASHWNWKWQGVFGSLNCDRKHFIYPQVYT